MPGKHDDLVEEAQEEWEERGWAPQDFSLDKMIQVWEREDMTAMEKREAGGHSALKRKQQMIQATSAPLIDWEKLQQKLIKGAEVVQEKAVVAAFFLGRAVELPPRRRARQWREHRQLMVDQDENTAVAQQHQREPAYSQLAKDKKYLDGEAKAYRIKKKIMQPIVEKRTREAKHAKKMEEQGRQDEYEKKRERWEFDDNEKTR
jgi:hypothetical protein